MRDGTLYIRNNNNNNNNNNYYYYYLEYYLVLKLREQPERLTSSTLSCEFYCQNGRDSSE